MSNPLTLRLGGSRLAAAAAALMWMVWPQLAFAGSPFATGTAAGQGAILTILTPVAVIAVMATGAAAWFGKISWWWFLGCIAGTVLVFGAPQIVAWIRGLFGV